MKKAVLFGGGNIGRSFITPVFQDAGYHIIIVDMNEELINLLNKKKEYKVVICDQSGQKSTIVRDYEAVHLSEKDRLTDILIQCDLIITSVGQRGLASVCSLLGDVLGKRITEEGCRSLDVVLAENIPDGASLCRRLIGESLKDDFPVDSHLGVVETSIGKMVPLLSDESRAEDPLRLYAEPYDTLILDRTGFRGDLPVSKKISLVSPIQAYVDRKLYIHNMGHAAAAYFGRAVHPGRLTIREVLEDENILEKVRSAMMISAQGLYKEYPGLFSHQDLEDHVEDLLFRFRNKALGDTVQRVGRDLKRKLSPYDRICGAMKLAWKHGLPLDILIEVYRASSLFGLSPDADEEDRKICLDGQHNGIQYLFKTLSASDIESDLHIQSLISG